jgi:hypothetical protein
VDEAENAFAVAGGLYIGRFHPVKIEVVGFQGGSAEENHGEGYGQQF